MSWPDTLRAGLTTGLLLGGLDWLAAGVQRTPWPVALVVVGFAIGIGALAAVLAGALRIGRSATGLAAGGFLALQNAALLAEYHHDSPTDLADIASWSIAAASAISFGVLTARSRRNPGAATGALIAVLAAVPLASLATSLAPQSIRGVLVCSALPPMLAVVVIGIGSRRRLSNALAGILALILGLSAGLEDPGPERTAAAGMPTIDGLPSIVLVVIDTLGDAYVSERTTPSIHRVAERGVRFLQAISSAGWTLPSHASLLSGLDPAEHGALDTHSRLSDARLTLAEALAAQGYECVAFTGGGFVSAEAGFDQGFERFDPQAEREFRRFRIHTPVGWRFVRNPIRPLLPVLRRVSGRGGIAALRRKVEAWLAARNPERPFFLFVHSYEVHDYFFYDPYADDWERERPEAEAALFRGRMQVPVEEVVHSAAAELEVFHGIYRHRVRHVDYELGRLLDSVDRHLAPTQSIVLITSDHGEGFDAELDRRIHGGDRLQDDLLHVPMILRAEARVPTGIRVAEQVRLTDVMPTLLDLAGLPIPVGLAGVSLRPRIAGTAAWPRFAFSEGAVGARRLASVRTREWKLVSGPAGDAGYELRTDPREVHDRSDAVPEALRGALGAYLRRPQARSENAAPYDDAMRKRLRALGYTLD